jgi:hypothetical protein
MWSHAMKKLKKIPPVIFIALVLSMLTATHCMAGLYAEVRADAEGLYLNYDLGSLYGSKEVSLAPGALPEEIFSMAGVITVEAAITEITTEPAMVKLLVTASGSICQDGPVEIPIAVPFGGYGAYAGFLERKIIPLENHAIDAAFLLTRLKTDYAVTCNLESLFSGHWEGTATPENNTIHEVVINPLDNSTMADVTLVLNYDSPYFTGIDYTIILNKPQPGEDEIFAADESSTTPETITGTVLVPNGAYHIWADPDLSAITLPEE